MELARLLKVSEVVVQQMWVKELVCGVRLRGTKAGRKTRVRTS